MKNLIIIAVMALLMGCANTADTDAKSFLETLEFEGEEYGSIHATGNIKVGGVPFFQSEIHIDYQKTKDAPVYEE